MYSAHSTLWFLSSVWFITQNHLIVSGFISLWYKCLMNFHWNLNFKSKAKRILMASENWDREEFICCPFVCFLLYHWLPCRYLIEGPLIISMDWYHWTPGILSSGPDVLRVSRGIGSILAWIIENPNLSTKSKWKKQTSFSCSKGKTHAEAHNVFNVLVDSNRLVSFFTFISLIRW